MKNQNQREGVKMSPRSPTLAGLALDIITTEQLVGEASLMRTG